MTHPTNHPEIVRTIVPPVYTENETARELNEIFEEYYRRKKKKKKTWKELKELYF
jgi:hypothetical protein